MDEKMKFNMPISLFDKQADGVLEEQEVESNSPIHEGEVLEPCVRGLQKIQKNENLLNAIRAAMGVVLAK